MVLNIELLKKQDIYKWKYRERLDSKWGNSLQDRGDPYWWKD